MDARETANHDLEPDATQARPDSAAPSLEPLGGALAPAGRSLSGLPTHPTANALRQNQLLHIQQRRGNASVQRLIRGLQTAQRARPSGGDAGESAPPPPDRPDDAPTEIDPTEQGNVSMVK